MATQEPQTADESVLARMDFCPHGEKVIFYPGDRAKSQWPYTEHEVVIRDMRPIADDLAMEKNGFVLVERQSAVRDFWNTAEVERVYLPEVMSLIGELTGADKVITFGTMLRTDAQQTAQHNLPAYGAHVDYGDYTVRQFAIETLGEALALAD